MSPSGGVPLRDRIYAAVRGIPSGRVSTYGRVAALAGLPRQARLVGYALSALPASTRVPWHRVVNAAGAVSLRRGDGDGSLVQRMRLEREGVGFDARGRIDLTRFGWPADQRRARRTGIAREGRGRPSSSRSS